MTHNKTSNACRKGHHEKCNGVIFNPVTKTSSNCRCRCHEEVLRGDGRVGAGPD